jgi:predicted naringenin-chalcone synthase
MDAAPVFINRIGTAVPPHEVHGVFCQWAEAQVAGTRSAALFRRMAARSGISSRWSVLPPGADGSQVVSGFYGGPMPGTAARMEVYAEASPPLAVRAMEGLGPIGDATHLVVASCTGFVAPGLDQIVAQRMGLSRSIQRTMIGFMGCYAAVVALRTAAQIVAADPRARVVVLALELTTLHLQGTGEVEALLAMLQFGDGAAAALVTAEPHGLALTRFSSLAVPDSEALITWTIGDQGFVMQLAGAVPGRIADALGDPAVREVVVGEGAADGWAVHAGGRSVLDAVERALGLAPEALAHSRAVLQDKGNMSSATLLFVLARFLTGERVSNGVGMAFGPGLSAESFGFRHA